MSKLSLKDRVLCHLYEHGEITSWEAIKEYGATRLSAIIFNLRNEGWNIENEWVESKNRYGDKVRYVKYKLDVVKIKVIKKEITAKDIEFVSIEEVK